LESSSEFEKRFAEKLINTYKNPIMPKLPLGFIDMIDKSMVYEQYAEYLSRFINNSSYINHIPQSSWINLLANENKSL
jgi:hypothetical protein